MKQAAQAQAAKDNVRLSVAAGTADGDTQSQINAIDTAIARGDKGILITSNGDAVNAALRQAKDNGLFVIALDTPLNPASTADITYATDNEAAGKLVGKYAAAKLAGKHAVIAMLDLFNTQIVSVDVNRDHGFLEGMGIDPRSTSVNAKEAKSGKYSGGTYTIACHQPTQGAVDGGRTAMEQCLSANPAINVVYTINEPAARGAFAALTAAGKQNSVILVSIDGSCEGMADVKSGEFDADATQYPGKMAALGVASIAKFGAGWPEAVGVQRQGLPRHRHRVGHRREVARTHQPDAGTSSCRPAGAVPAAEDRVTPVSAREGLGGPTKGQGRDSNHRRGTRVG